MTHGQYKRLRKWERETAPAYQAGVMDGMDAAFVGEPRPQEIVSELDTNFYIRRYMRHAQAISNAALARARGRVDGWDQATELQRKADEDDYIEREVATGMEQIADYLRGMAA